jgi:hypothetical protein
MKLIDVLLQYVTTIPISISEVERQIGFVTEAGKPNTMLRQAMQRPEKYKISNKHIPVLLLFCLKNGLKLYQKQITFQYQGGEESSLTIEVELWRDTQTIKTQQLVFDASELLYKQDWQIDAPNPPFEIEGEVLSCDKTKTGYILEVTTSTPFAVGQKVKIKG